LVEYIKLHEKVSETGSSKPLTVVKKFFLTSFSVLGSNLRWARYWPYRNLPWRFRFTAGENKCILQWGYRYDNTTENKRNKKTNNCS